MINVKPAKIVLEMHNRTYSVEGLPWDIGSSELLRTFKELMVAASFPPAILDDEFGHYEWVEDKTDDVVQ